MGKLRLGFNVLHLGAMAAHCLLGAWPVFAEDPKVAWTNQCLAGCQRDQMSCSQNLSSSLQDQTDGTGNCSERRDKCSEYCAASAELEF